MGVDVAVAIDSVSLEDGNTGHVAVDLYEVFAGPCAPMHTSSAGLACKSEARSEKRENPYRVAELVDLSVGADRQMSPSDPVHRVICPNYCPNYCWNSHEAFAAKIPNSARKDAWRFRIHVPQTIGSANFNARGKTGLDLAGKTRRVKYGFGATR